MKKYLLDTNICIFFLNGKFDLDKKIEKIGLENCCISEMTIAELKFGVENSKYIEQNRKIIASFQSKMQILTIFESLDFYAKEKARLRKLGTPIDEFDLLIAATAVTNGLVMVTNNVAHFNKIDGINIEDWTKQK